MRPLSARCTCFLGGIDLQRNDRQYRRAIVWLRRDLRLHDHVALAAAASQAREVALAFVIDPVLLSCGRIGAPLVQTFFEALEALRGALRDRGSELALLQGDCEIELLAFAQRTGADALFYNEDYEPHAIARDERVERAFKARGIAAHSFLDHVCLGADEVRTDTGEPYRVYTPYAKRWRDRYAFSPVLPVDSANSIEGRLLDAGTIGTTLDVPEMQAFGFTPSSAYPRCTEDYARRSLETFLEPGGDVDSYGILRDVPSADATSHLSVQLRAGTIGVRTVFANAFRAARDPKRRESVDKWISELIWREFYQMLLKCHPRLTERAFVEAGDRLTWKNDERAFAAWCEGRTGYPIVDAAMRQLNQTGWMHNRLRMIVASFLTKDLLIDWRWGEHYFETHLADADVAQNNGGWQWAASTGADAAPYFRIFNPVLQSKKFDPDGSFIRAMIPELRSLAADAIHAPWEHPLLAIDYPPPIVDHREARERALASYAPILGKKAR